jgi:hypothetical protein
LLASVDTPVGTGARSQSLEGILYLSYSEQEACGC